jgi:hypothetical protein
VVMFGQILTGLAQPFVLAAPTRYSDMWFTERGRTGATALASLANPLGGAVSTSHISCGYKTVDAFAEKSHPRSGLRHLERLL